MSPMQFRPTYAEINLDNLAHNTRLLRALVPADSFFCPMVKANAYGHGDVAIANHLVRNCAVRTLGVSLVEEGIRLREAGIKCEILVFGTTDREIALRAMLEFNLTVVVGSLDQLKCLSTLVSSPVDIHIKWDTGMGRLGIPATQITEVRAVLLNCGHLRVQGMLTHLHSGEDAENLEGATAHQLKVFRPMLEKIAPAAIIHVWNTAALLALSEKADRLTEFGARPGIGIYGLSTAEHQLALKPVMNLRSNITKINSLRPGESVSYGATWKAEHPAKIAVLPIGYADGVHRILSNVGKVLVAGRRAPIVGRVCMDYVMIDVTEFESADRLVGESVTLFGSDQNGNILSAFEVAQMAQTAAWEILTSVSSRVPRHYLTAESK